MGGGEGDEFAGGDDFGLFPEWGEVAGVAGDEVVGAGGVGTFEEDVVGGVGGGCDTAGRVDEVGAFAEKVEELAAEGFADAEFGAGEDVAIFGENRRGDVEACGAGEGQEEDSALQAGGIEGGGDDDVGVENEAESEHQDFGLRARVLRMRRSIWAEVSLSVPLRIESAPRSWRISGSGAARRT